MDGRQINEYFYCLEAVEASDSILWDLDNSAVISARLDPPAPVPAQPAARDPPTIDVRREISVESGYVSSLEPEWITAPLHYQSYIADAHCNFTATSTSTATEGEECLQTRSNSTSSDDSTQSKVSVPSGNLFHQL